MNRIKLVVLDMAGTTIDEDNLVYKTVQSALATHGYEVNLQTVLAQAAGKEKRQAIIDVLSAIGVQEDIGDIASRVFDEFKTALKRGYEVFPVRAFHGVDSLIAAIRQHGVKVVLNTGYDRHTAETLIAKVGWTVGSDIDGLVTADDVVRGRPYPDMIFKAMEIGGISEPGQVLKAGDSAVDIEEGRNAGCGVTVGVMTGAQTREQLEAAGPTHVLNSLVELRSLNLF
jgi:phosphonatase-like hydrolase